MLTLLKPEAPTGRPDVYETIKPVVKQFQETLSEQQIVILLQARNQQGLRALYDKYAHSVYGLIYRIIGRKDFAENALQDTFLKVWQNIESYDVSKGRFLSWVLRIARNAAIDVKRSKVDRHQMREVELQQNFATNAANAVELQVEHIGLRENVGKLSPLYRELIELTYFEGFTYAEAAEELGLPLGTVKSRIRKAFKELRVILD